MISATNHSWRDMRISESNQNNMLDIHLSITFFNISGALGSGGSIGNEMDVYPNNSFGSRVIDSALN